MEPTDSPDDKPGIVVTPTSGLIVSEAGTSASFSVVLNTQPGFDVYIDLSCSDASEGTIDRNNVTFNPGNWNSPQSVNVTGCDDAIKDGNVSFVIEIHPAVSNDPAYNDLDGEDVSVINIDDEIPGITIHPTDGLLTSENGGSDTFDVVFDCPPESEINFNWSQPQTVIVSGQDDASLDGNRLYTVNTSPVTSADPEYDGMNPPDVSVVNLENDAPVAAGSRHTMHVESDGSLWGWGGGTLPLGMGDVPPRNLPTPVGYGNTWYLVAAGSAHNVALKNDGTLWSWGANVYGQLGDGTTTSTPLPKRIGVDSDWAMAFAGASQTVAIKADGSLWSWGWNRWGKLGDGTTEDWHIPTRIGYDYDWSYVAVGTEHVIALKEDGSCWTWGNSPAGVLGDGTSSDKYVPTRVGGDNHWVELAPGDTHFLALKSDGTIWSWGSNDSGQLGDGTKDVKNVPGKIGSDSDWTSLAAAPSHSIAIKGDGTLWAWGRNGQSQLGDGTTVDRHVPAQIGSDTDWISASGGGDADWGYTLALQSDGTLYAWGFNGFGELGDDTTHLRQTPTQIGSEADWSFVAAAGHSSAAVKSDGSLWTWGLNYSGSLGHGPYWRSYPSEVP